MVRDGLRLDDNSVSAFGAELIAIDGAVETAFKLVQYKVILCPRGLLCLGHPIWLATGFVLYASVSVLWQLETLLDRFPGLWAP